jgi:hypothetical protein
MEVKRGGNWRAPGPARQPTRLASRAFSFSTCCAAPVSNSGWNSTTKISLGFVRGAMNMRARQGSECSRFRQQSAESAELPGAVSIFFAGFTALW